MKPQVEEEDAFITEPPLAADAQLERASPTLLKFKRPEPAEPPPSGIYNMNFWGSKVKPQPTIKLKKHGEEKLRTLSQIVDRNTKVKDTEEDDLAQYDELRSRMKKKLVRPVVGPAYDQLCKKYSRPDHEAQEEDNLEFQKRRR